MKIPKSVNIMGHEYRIKRLPQDKMPQNRMGECEWPSRVITLSKELTGELAYSVFLHEVWHGVQFESGDTQILHDQVCEKHCDRFASIIRSLQKQKVI
jgi:hypothetical protein